MAILLWRPALGSEVRLWKYARSGVRRWYIGELGMDDGCCGDVTGVVRLFRRQFDRLEDVGSQRCSHDGLLMV